MCKSTKMNLMGQIIIKKKHKKIVITKRNGDLISGIEKI